MWFKRDDFMVGFVLSTLLTVGSALLIVLILRLLEADLLVQMKTFLFSVVGEIFLLRYYLKSQQTQSAKGSVLALVMTLGTILVFLIKYNYLTLK